MLLQKSEDENVQFELKEEEKIAPSNTSSRVP